MSSEEDQERSPERVFTKLKPYSPKKWWTNEEIACLLEIVHYENIVKHLNRKKSRSTELFE